MGGSDELVRYIAHLEALLVAAEGGLVVADEVVGEAEVVPDVEVKTANGRVTLVGYSIRLDLKTGRSAL